MAQLYRLMGGELLGKTDVELEGGIIGSVQNRQRQRKVVFIFIYNFIIW